MISFGPDHHFGGGEGIIPSPELPDDPAVVVVVGGVYVIFAVQIRFKATEKKTNAGR